MGVVSMVFVGLIAGLLARALLPSRNAMGWVATSALGILGAFVGRTLLSLAFLGGALSTSVVHPAGVLGSVVGALVVLGLHHWVRGWTYAKSDRLT